MMRVTQAGDIVRRLAQLLATAPSTRAEAVLDLLAERAASYPQTPVRVFEIPVAGRVRRVRLKLEGESPWRSIKGRTAVGLLVSIADRITDGNRLVESTSGNLGVALAALCRATCTPFTAVVDDRLPASMDRRIRASGADLVVADHRRTGGDRLTARMETVAAMIDADSRMLWPNQYDNPANPLVHEIWTGPEFLAQVPTAQAIFIGVSTGGTLAGCARAVRATGRDVKVVGVDVEGSQVFGGARGPRILTGIGASRMSTHLDQGTYDAVETVTGWSGIKQCRDWKRSTGLGLGGSSGAVLAAALRHLEAHPELTDIACLCPDLRDNYQETIYNDRWVASQWAETLEREREV